MKKLKMSQNLARSRLLGVSHSFLRRLWQSKDESRQDNDQPLSTLEAARRLAFILQSAKEEQRRAKMVDVTPDASDPERQT
jgi:hypothetical protein